MTYPADENEFDKRAKEINIPNQYKNTDYGKKSKVVPRKIKLSYTDGSGKVYGYKTIMTKENKCTLVDFLITENEDLSALPEQVIREIRTNIRKGAADLIQQWRDALELVHTAYHVAKIRRPTPNEKAAWKQYMDLIKYGVHQLRVTRGVKGGWRITDPAVNESADDDTRPLGKRRFFVEIPGETPREVEADNMDDIIEKMSNKLRRDGAKLRVTSRDKFVTTAVVLVDGVVRERIVIKEV